MCALLMILTIDGTLVILHFIADTYDKLNFDVVFDHPAVVSVFNQVGTYKLSWPEKAENRACWNQGT